MSLSAKVWTFRILLILAVVSLCALARSPIPSWALAIAWSPNGFFLAAYMKGVLRFPRVLEPIHPLEPALYRWLGVGLVKRIVANDVWPRIHGFKPSPLPKNREEFLYRIEFGMKAAEICHAATFILAACVAGYCVAVAQGALALWTMVFNVLLNAYPVMLQRFNRWRMHAVHAALRAVPVKA